MESALEMTNELLELQPNHQRAKGNKNWYENVLKEQEEDSNKRGDDGTMDVTISSVVSCFHTYMIINISILFRVSQNLNLYELVSRTI